MWRSENEEEEMIKEKKRDKRRRKFVISGKTDEGGREYGRLQKESPEERVWALPLVCPFQHVPRLPGPRVCPLRRLDVFKGLSKLLFSWPHGRHLITITAVPTWSPFFISPFIWRHSLPRVVPKSCKKYLTLGCLLLNLAFFSLFYLHQWSFPPCCF